MIKRPDIKVERCDVHSFLKAHKLTLILAGLPGTYGIKFQRDDAFEAGLRWLGLLVGLVTTGCCSRYRMAFISVSPRQPLKELMIASLSTALDDVKFCYLLSEFKSGRDKLRPHVLDPS